MLLQKKEYVRSKEEKAVQMPYLDFFQKTAAFLEKCGNYGWRLLIFWGEAGEPKEILAGCGLIYL